MRSNQTAARARPVPLAAPHALQRPLSLPMLRWSDQTRVILALAAMTAVWTFFIAHFYPTPPWDNVEELFWARSFEFGYYKHPPLPSWIMGVLVRVAGPQPWVTYAAGVACGAGALFIVWKWALQLTVPARALVALVLGSLVTYHVQRAVIYNHNTVQLFSLAGYWWMLWRVLHAPAASRYRDWAWLGVFAALAFLTKYSAAVQFAVGLAFIVREGAWRLARVQAGIAIALGVAGLMALPHFVWMATHPDLSIAYALHSVHQKTEVPYSYGRLLHIVGMQVARIGPMVLFVLWAWLARPRNAASAPTPAPAAATAGKTSSFDLRFLTWATFGPICAVIPLAAIFKLSLHPSWFTTFFLPAALWAALRVPGLDAENWSRRRWRAVLATVAALHVAAAVGQGWGEGVQSLRMGHKTRPNLPAQDIALAVADIWHQRAGDAPLRLLVGDTWFAGAVALKMGPGMELLIDGDERDSPWLAPGTLRREGGMVLISDTPGFESEGALLPSTLATADCQGTLQLPWGGKDAAHGVRLRWGIVLPHGQRALRCGR